MLDCFSSVEELEPIFKKGVRVVFERYLRFQGLLCVNQTTNVYEISIATTDKNSLLLEQQVTLLHELIHAYRQLVGLEQPRNIYLAYIDGPDSYEKFIDRLAYGVVLYNPALFQAIVCEIITRSNCQFVYEVDTAFRSYHRALVSKLMTKIASTNLAFGDEATSQILLAARTMGLSCANASLPLAKSARQLLLPFG